MGAVLVRPLEWLAPNITQYLKTFPEHDAVEVPRSDVGKCVDISVYH